MPEYVNCNLCDADETELIVNTSQYNIPCAFVRCRRCGLVYMNPRPTEGELEAYYQKEYRAEEGVNKKYIQRGQARAKNQMRYIKRAWPTLTKTKGLAARMKVLDIGGGAGFVLNLFLKNNWDAYLVEPGGAAAEYARNRFNITVHEGTFDKISLPEGIFDVVVLSHTLEHVGDPLGSLSKACRLLSKEGKLFVEVPNLNHSWIKSSLLITLAIYSFTPQILERMLSKAGLEMLALDIASPKYPASLLSLMKGLSYGEERELSSDLNGSGVLANKGGYPVLSGYKEALRKSYELLNWLYRVATYGKEKYYRDIRSDQGLFIRALAQKRQG